MRKLLLVTYHFPPDLAVGAIRPGTFAKYLSEVGWNLDVLTVDAGYYNKRSQSLSDGDCVGVTVTRTGMLRSPSHYYRIFQRILPTGKSQPHVGQPSTDQQKKSANSRLRRWISSLLSLPDEQGGWFPFAVIKGMNLIRRKGIDVIMTSGPPHSVHLIGACLTKLARIPWVADFRDPYLDSNYLRPAAGEEDIRRKLARRLETWFMSRATFILTTTKRYTELLQSRYPLDKHKMFTLPNGFDLEEFDGIPREKEKKFTISYLGSLYWHRDPELVLRALSELIGEKQINPSNVMVRFFVPPGEASKVLNAVIPKYGLCGIVETGPWLPRRYALEVMVRSHVLLLLAEDQPLSIPGKIYEYLGAGSEILAITRDGATADLLRETGTGIVVSPDDYLGVKAKIKGLYVKHLRADQHNRESSVVGNVPPTKYNRKCLTEELARFLEKASHGLGT